MDNLNRHRVEITEADNGFIIAAGRIGFPDDYLAGCKDTEELVRALKEILSDWGLG